jgi:hypothetical protein
MPRPVPATVDVEAMSEKPLFYQEVQALNPAVHGNLRYVESHDRGFSRGANAVFLNTVEFAHASHEYPIVFAGNPGAFAPVAVLGVEKDRNLLVGEDGTWNARYIPAYVRRYPFIVVDDARSTVCIDSTASAFGTEGEGERLFDEEGKETHFLQQKIRFLKEYEGARQATRAFASRLEELDLLESMQANVAPTGGKKYSLRGFHVVGRQRLGALGAETLAELQEKGLLELIYRHLFSLDNFSRFLELLPPASD